MIGLSIMGSVGLIMCGLIVLQKNHQSFEKSKWENLEIFELSQELDARSKEFDEYKKKVDALTLRAGFNL